MIQRIENISREYAGYILKVTIYNYGVERHSFDTAEELEAYCWERDLAVDTDAHPYDVSEWSDGTWLVINAEPAHQLDPINY